jgi:hypothetical protein
MSMYRSDKPKSKMLLRTNIGHQNCIIATNDYYVGTQTDSTQSMQNNSGSRHSDPSSRVQLKVFSIANIDTLNKGIVLCSSFKWHVDPKFNLHFRRIYIRFHYLVECFSRKFHYTTLVRIKFGAKLQPKLFIYIGTCYCGHIRFR